MVQWRRRSSRPGKEPTITAEAKAWLVSLACRKAKDLGYPHELWTRADRGAAASPAVSTACSHETVPQPGFGGRKGYQPRGRGLGGSSLINAMIYTRGQPQDYDSWAALGRKGWRWADVLPYFKRSEDNAKTMRARSSADRSSSSAAVCNKSPASSCGILYRSGVGLTKNASVGRLLLREPGE